MQTVYGVTADKAENIKELYINFVERSYTDYGFEIQPLPFEDFKANMEAGYIKTLVFEENHIPKALLIYIDSLNEAIELNLIHCLDNENLIERKKMLTKAFIETVKSTSALKTISYPMMGIQNDFVQDIAHFGFKFIGQAVFEFDFDNEIQNKIFATVEQKIPEGYSFTGWNDKYSDEVADIILEQFSIANDAKFDPRFCTINGVKDILQHITGSIYGDFCPTETTILLKDKEVWGICFINLTTAYTANIPLIAIKRPHNHKGFGTLVLSNSLSLLKDKRERESLKICSINATTDTDNYPALRMYRKLGFKEKFNYPHAYLNF